MTRGRRVVGSLLRVRAPGLLRPAGRFAAARAALARNDGTRRGSSAARGHRADARGGRARARSRVRRNAADRRRLIRGPASPSRTARGRREPALARLRASQAARLPRADPPRGRPRNHRAVSRVPRDLPHPASQDLARRRRADRGSAAKAVACRIAAGSTGLPGGESSEARPLLLDPRLSHAEILSPLSARVFRGSRRAKVLEREGNVQAPDT